MTMDTRTLEQVIMDASGKAAEAKGYSAAVGCDSVEARIIASDVREWMKRNILVSGITQTIESLIEYVEPRGSGDTQAAEFWRRAYNALLHLKVDVFQATEAEAHPEWGKWPEPPLKPPASRFDGPPGTVEDEER